MMKSIMNFFLLLSMISLPGDDLLCQQNNNGILISETGQRPVIQIDSLDNIHIIWWDFGIYHSIYDTNGNQLIMSSEIVSFGSQYTDLAVGDDNSIVVWEEPTPNFESHIWGKMYSLDVDTSNSFRINDLTNPVSHHCDANVVHVMNNSFFVVWSWDYGNIFGQFISSNRSGKYNNIMLNDYPILDVTFPKPKVIGIEDCPHLVVWIDDRNNTPLLYGRTLSTTGVPLDSSFLISESPDIVEVTNSSLIMNDCGEITVTYIAMLDDSVTHVIHKTITPDGQAVTSSQAISQTQVGESIDMGKQTDGKYIVEWEAIFDGHSRIAAQRFDSDGSLVGDNFWVTGIVDSVDQLAPSVILHNDVIYSAWYEQDYENTRSSWLNIIDFNNPPVSNSGETSMLAYYSLLQNYPNPFNPITTIQYELPQRSDVQITIYDLLGKEVATLVSETQDAGFRSVQWDGTNVASGVYLYQIKAGKYVQTRKMVLLK